MSSQARTGPEWVYNLQEKKAIESVVPSRGSEMDPEPGYYPSDDARNNIVLDMKLLTSHCLDICTLHVWLFFNGSCVAKAMVQKDALQA